MQKNKVYIIGIAPDGVSSLSSASIDTIKQGEIIFGGERILKMFPAAGKKKFAIKNNLDKITRTIQANIGIKRMVVLASGDPDLFGIAKYLTTKLGKDIVEIIPNVSAMQIAFARIKESWDDAVFVSAHSRPIKDIINTVLLNHKIGIFTDNKHNPATIAEVLLKQGVQGYRAYICENLGVENENIIEADLHTLPSMKFSPLNILILLKKPSVKFNSKTYPLLLGIPDTEFHQRKPKGGLITKQEVRAVSLAKMRLTDNSIVWDIGAGSGSVSIEASFLAKFGRVYAIEKNDLDVAIIQKNIKKFNASNVQVIQTFAPDNLDNLPDPTTVFIGGSGCKMAEIMDVISNRIKSGGHIVANIVSLENLNIFVNNLKLKGVKIEVTLVNIAHSVSTADINRLEALNPVFVVSGLFSSDKSIDHKLSNIKKLRDNASN